MTKPLFLIALFFSFLAAAEEPDAQARVDSPARAAPSLEISLKAGGHFPQLVNKLGTSFDAILKVGVMPTSSRQLQLFVDLGYSQPSQRIEDNDPRLDSSGADYHSTLVLKDLATTVGATYFFSSPAEHLVPFAGAGLRAHFLRAEVVGAADSEFGPSAETDTRLGGVAFGGVMLHLGPGVAIGELAFGYAPVSLRTTGISNIGALSLMLGYGLLL